jgi:2-polyprenyl-6-methoxyphenol hydroxylase-like FAD-dependent oxidoreductase
VGVPDAYLDGVRLRGPFATFDGAHRWIDRPYRDGVVLVGDAAAASDPAWGNGLSRTLRDVRLLSDALLADEHWARAAKSYAVKHDDFCARLRDIERLYARLWMSIGPQADARRERALAVLEDEPEFNISVWGPETQCDATLRARLLDA